MADIFIEFKTNYRSYARTGVFNWQYNYTRFRGLIHRQINKMLKLNTLFARSFV